MPIAAVRVVPAHRRAGLGIMLALVFLAFWLGRALCVTIQAASYLVPYDVSASGWSPRVR